MSIVKYHESHYVTVFDMYVFFHSEDSEGPCVITAIILYHIWTERFKSAFYRETFFSVHWNLFSFLGKKQ